MILNTVATIAETAGVPPHRVKYLILRDGLKPLTRVGMIALYSDPDADYIARELRRIDAGRQAVAP